jgi:DNA-binding HxlR family transcriptional regulator
MTLLDLLGRRWALRILWELRDGPVPTFRELQARCGELSSSVLNQRIRELREAGILSKESYALTDRGHELLTLLAPLDAWAKQWGAQAARRARRRA